MFDILNSFLGFGFDVFSNFMQAVTSLNFQQESFPDFAQWAGVVFSAGSPDPEHVQRMVEMQEQVRSHTLEPHVVESIKASALGGVSVTDIAASTLHL
jgi:hypothetical protein